MSTQQQAISKAAHCERGGEVKIADTALAEPSQAEAARRERMKREG